MLCVTIIPGMSRLSSHVMSTSSFSPMVFGGSSCSTISSQGWRNIRSRLIVKDSAILDSEGMDGHLTARSYFKGRWPLPPSGVQLLSVWYKRKSIVLINTWWFLAFVSRISEDTIYKGFLNAGSVALVPD